MIPTCVDTTRFVPSPDAFSRNGAEGREPIVGWIGSPTTAPYVRTLGNVFRRVRERHPFVLRVSGTGEPLDVRGISTDNPPWTLADELAIVLPALVAVLCPQGGGSHRLDLLAPLS